jgi:outer membrane biosynthesis protein TonB
MRKALLLLMMTTLMILFSCTVNINTDTQSATGNRSSDHLLAVVNSILEPLRLEYYQFLPSNPEAKGEIDIKLTIGADGRVKDATVTMDTIGLPAFTTIVQNKARTLDFGADTQTSFVFTATYKFEPNGTEFSGPAVGAVNRSPSVVEELVQKQMPPIVDRYSQLLANNPSLEGDILVQFTVGSDGFISSVEVISDTLGNSELTGTVLNMVRGLYFGPTDQGEMTVRFPFRFFRK